MQLPLDLSTDQSDASIRKHPCAKCEICPLRAQPYVPSSGPLDAELIVVAQAPGRTEATEGRPLVGASGKLLDSMVQAAGHDPDKIYRTNVVSCYPPDDREPTETEIYACSERLQYDLEQVKCERVMPLGKLGTQAILGLAGHADDAKEISITSKRGIWFHWPEKGRMVLPTWHPAYVLRSPGSAIALRNDIRAVYGEGPSQLLQQPQVIHVQSSQQLRELLDAVPDREWVAFDLETNQVEWYDRPGALGEPILCLALCWDTSFGIIIDDTLLYDDEEARDILRRFFARVQTVGHNGKFDVVFLRHIGIQAHVTFDTMLAHYALDENSPHGLKSIAQDEFGIPDYEEALIKQYLRSASDEYSKIPTPKLYQYAVWDVAVTLKLREVFTERLQRRRCVSRYPHIQGQTLYEWPFMNLLMPAQDVLSDMEFRGIGVDREHLLEFRKTLEEELKVLESYLREVSGKEGLNPRAPGQVADVLYVDYRLPRPKGKDRQGRDLRNSTAKGILETLEVKYPNHPFLRPLMQFRRIDKIRGSYVENTLGFMDCEGRVHADYRVMGTEVGRLAVRDPALQTVPRASDRYGRMIRNAFIPTPARSGERPGRYIFVISDWSQAELRVAAFYSQEPFLIRVYEEDRDLHTEGTIAMFGTPEQIAERRSTSLEEAKVVWKELRVRVKMFNFAYLYGGTEHSFAQDQGLPIGEAIAFVRRYEENMPVLAQWKRDRFAFAKKYGFVETIFGRRRRFPLINSDKKVLDDIRKASVHATVAGTASDLTLLAVVDLVREGIQVELTVHDSIISRCHIADYEKVKSLQEEIMLSKARMYMPTVKWVVDTDPAMECWAGDGESSMPAPSMGDGEHRTDPERLRV